MGAWARWTTLRLIYIPGDFRAANGDRLFATSAVDFDVDTGIAIGTLTFTGGTGRFQDATGSADVMFVLDLGPPVLPLPDRRVDRLLGSLSGNKRPGRSRRQADLSPAS